MFDTLAPEMSGFNRVALSNLWLFGPLVQPQLEKGASSNAMLRTTTALTIVQAGNKDNVLPGHAEAAVNFRMLPGDTLASSRRTCAQDGRQRRDQDRALSGQLRAVAGLADRQRRLPHHRAFGAPDVPGRRSSRRG